MAFGFDPQVEMTNGLVEYLTWARGEHAASRLPTEPS
jgi:hypothetical protein